MLQFAVSRILLTVSMNVQIQGYVDTPMDIVFLRKSEKSRLCCTQWTPGQG